jgi:hypothetical protein
MCLLISIWAGFMNLALILTLIEKKLGIGMLFQPIIEILRLILNSLCGRFYSGKKKQEMKRSMKSI